MSYFSTFKFRPSKNCKHLFQPITMDNTYSTANILGYKQHLASQVVTLPLKYPTKSSITTANEEFQNKLSNSGGLINLNGSVVELVSYEVLNDLKTIILTPLDSSSNSLGYQYQKLQIELSHKLISTNCLSVSLNEQKTLIIDIIDENFLFITLKVDISDFLYNKNSKINKFTLDDFRKWGNISVPYSFEMRSFPYFLKAIDSLNLIVSLKDGGLLHFQRPTELSDFDIYNFDDTTSLVPLNFISGLFKRSPKQEIVLEGISSNSIVDLIKLNEEYFITFSVSKMIKVWNLNTHQPAITPIKFNENIDSGSWLTSVPTKYIQIYEEAGETFLSLHYTSDDKEKRDDKVSGHSGFSIKTFKIIFSPTLELVESFDLGLSSPNLLTSQTSLWFIQDFQIEAGDMVKFHILWKSNTSAVAVTYAVDKGIVSSTCWSNISQDGTNEFSPYHDVSYYSNKVLNSGNYDNLILSTSLNILREHIGLEHIDQILPIGEATNETIQTASNIKQQDAKSFWFKLYSLCEEFKKYSEAPLALAVARSFLLSLNSNGLGVFRKSHYYEVISSSSQGGSSSLSSILSSFSTILSTKSYNKLSDEIRKSSHLTSDGVTDLYETFLGSKMSHQEIQSILSELENIPDVMDTINSIIDSIEVIEDIGTSKEIGILTKLNTVATFKEIKSKHESILINLVMLFLICEGSNQILSLINQVLQRLNTYSIVDFLFETCFKSNEKDSKIESDLSNVEFSLFWVNIAEKYPYLKSLIQQEKVNEAYDYFYGNVISNYENFIVDVTIELINRREGKFIKNNFFGSLSESRIIDRFLMGIVYLINNEPNEFFKIFENYKVFYENKEMLKEKIYEVLGCKDDIRNFLRNIFGEGEDRESDESSLNIMNKLSSSEILALDKSNYYHSLSELSRSQANPPHSRSTSKPSPFTKFIDSQSNFIQTALNFEEIAIDILRSIQTPSEAITSKITAYYLNIFDFSLTLSRFDIVYEALSNLKHSTNFRELFTKFIVKLISNQSISTLFPPNNNLQSHYLLIDSILLELANNELTLATSLKHYEYLYSWRLFGASKKLGSDQLTDKRGAIESLYMFITRFKFEHNNLLTHTSSSEDLDQYKLKILELYMIILNCLRSFEDDEDRWIVKSLDDEKLCVIKYEEVKVEYYEWLAELERGMTAAY